MLTDREVQEFIEKNAARGSILGLDNVRELAKRMEHPEKDLKIIHIAGTNGKGSILAYLSAILQEAGYKVGRYLSPVIYDYREKIQVNGKKITKKALAEGIEIIQNCMEEMENDKLPLPTLFEIETVLALWYFKEKKCDFVILETGMGGKTDATNFIENPLLCIFASISMDHMAFLGNSLTEIAQVKAGILRKDVCAVSAGQPVEAKTVLVNAAKTIGAKLVFTKGPQNVKYGLEQQSFDYLDYKKCRIHISGVWQPENAAVAIEAACQLQNMGYHIPKEAVYQGLKNARWPGRFTILSKNPLFIMDGAHNEDAAKKLRKSFETYLKGKPLIFIIGVLKDKEYDKILMHTADLASQIITVTPPENPRALGAYELAKAAEKYCPGVTMADSLEEAVEMASLLAGKECAIIAFGSLSYLGKLEAVVKEKQKSSQQKNKVKK